MKAQLLRWGGGLAVRIPKTIVKQAGMVEGEDLSLSVEGGRICNREGEA